MWTEDGVVLSIEKSGSDKLIEFLDRQIIPLSPSVIAKEMGIPNPKVQLGRMAKKKLIRKYDGGLYRRRLS